MHLLRSLSVGLIAFAAIAANAQFDGPAPLAWRWLPPTGSAASGSPLVVKDTIYEACGGRIYAVDLATGNKKWQYPAEDPIPGRFRTAPILVNGMIVDTGDNKIVYAIDPATGNQKWTFVLPGSPFGQPVAVQNYVVQAQSDNKLVAIDTTTGQSLWKSADSDVVPINIADGLYGQIGAVDNAILYFTTKNELHSVDVITRKEDAWQMPIRFSQLDVNSTPLVFNDTIYVASGQFIVSVNPATGAANWQQSTGFETAFKPAVSAAGVFVCSSDGKAMVFDATTGTPATGLTGPIDLGSIPVTSPSAIGDKFAVLTTSGALELVDPTAGTVLWNYVIRPMGKVYANSNSNSGAGNGGPGGLGGPGGAGGPGGLGGPGGAGGQGGRFGGGGANGNSSRTEITEIQASGPAVLAGSTLLVPAKDSSLLAFDKSLGVDLTPPDTKMLFPVPGDEVAGVPPLLLYFRIRDEGSGVDESKIKISIDGKPYDFKYRRDGSVLVQFSNEGKNKPLGDGRHMITVESADWLGNAGKQTYSLLIDNSLPPIKLPGQNNSTPNQNGGLGNKGGGGGPGGGGDVGGGGGDGGGR